MAEDNRPVTAAGVKSTLKSLRTRTGLQADRLATTELALDALERLESVRSLQSRGRNRVAAIVEAVRDTARSLPATESLIVDAALSLGLYAKEAGDSDLYATDLSDRRYALLQAWDRLHTALGANPPAAPTARSLRLDLEDSALGLLATTLVGETPQQWQMDPVTSNDRIVGEDEPAAVVFGTAVYDHNLQLRDMPAPDTSAQAYEFEEGPGGKGLNQAVGLARLGAPVRLISPIGSDDQAAEMLDYLNAEGVDTRYLEMRQGSKSPRTIVLAFRNGAFLHVGWKNQQEIRFSRTFLHGVVVQRAIEVAPVILLTLEPPRDNLQSIFNVLASTKRCPLIVTASPPIEGPKLSGSDLRCIDYLIATEWELRHMLEDTDDYEDRLSPQDIIDRLLLAGVGTICVLGSNQCQVYGVAEDFVQPTPAPLVITDQSASKDAFASALASRIAKNGRTADYDFRYAYYAMLAAGMSFGTSSSLPTEQQIISLEKQVAQRIGSPVGGGK